MQKPQVRIDHGEYGCDVKIVPLGEVAVVPSRMGYAHLISDHGGEWELTIMMTGNQAGELWIGVMKASVDSQVRVENERFRGYEDAAVPQLVAAKINTLMGPGFAVPVDPAGYRADEARGLRARAAELREQADTLERRAHEKEKVEARSEV